MPKTKIEIIATDGLKIYSVGKVEISEKGDIYIIQKPHDVHLTRHADGKRHVKSKKGNIFLKQSKSVPINKFKGVEFLGTYIFKFESLPYFKEYKKRKSNGIFAIDMRHYKKNTFNMAFAILTEEGIPKLYEDWKNPTKKQIYIYTESNPMIAITCIGL